MGSSQRGVRTRSLFRNTRISPAAAAAARLLVAAYPRFRSFSRTRKGAPRVASQSRVPSVLPSSMRMISKPRPAGIVACRLATIARVIGRQLNRGTTNETCIPSTRIREKVPEVLCVGGPAEPGDVGLKHRAVDPAVAPGDLLQARDLQALPMLDHVDKVGGVEQGAVRSCVQPRRAASENLDMKPSGLEIDAVQVGDFQFSALGRLEGARIGNDIAVVEIDAWNRKIRLWAGGLFLQRKDPSIRREFHDAVGLRIGHVVTEDGRPVGALGRALERPDEVVPVKQIVAKDQGGGRVADKPGPDQES